jgi:RyR domain
MKVEEIARVVHEANRAVQVIQNDPSIPVSVDWDHLDEETKGSATVGVEGVINGNTPEQSHESWCKFKTDNGWVLGDVKDEVKKTHPLLVSYGDLPESARIKDDLFVAIVTALK